MKFLFYVLASVFFLWITISAGSRMMTRYDAHQVESNTQRIASCKSLGGHPTLYWHNLYRTWFLESCKL